MPLWAADTVQTDAETLAGNIVALRYCVAQLALQMINVLMSVQREDISESLTYELDRALLRLYEILDILRVPYVKILAED